MYICFLNASDVEHIMFSQTIENSVNDLRYNNNGTKTYVKYEDTMTLTFLDNIEHSIFEYEDAVEILSNEPWVDTSQLDGSPNLEYYKSEGMEI